MNPTGSQDFRGFGGYGYTVALCTAPGYRASEGARALKAIAYEEFHFSFVMLNLFQHPSRLRERTDQAEKWTLKQVQGDD